jgi:ribosomal protein S18 acetylase RimI-like enzyme
MDEITGMYAAYLEERTEDRCYQTVEGFVTYRIIYGQAHASVYIIDIYVKPEFRRGGAAAKMADTVVERARQLGCKELLGTVVPSTKNSTTSLQVLLGYGMQLSGANNDLVIFRKDI